LDTEDVVVNREHVHVGVNNTSIKLNGNLGVVDAREVASTGWLVFFWLEREGVAVHTWVWAASVVVVGLHLVEVLTLLSLESVLTVEDKLEGLQWTGVVFSEFFWRPAVDTGSQHWNTGTLGDWHIGVRRELREDVGFEDDFGAGRPLGEVPQGGGDVGRGRIVKAPDKLLNWVVEGETLVGGGTRSNSVNTSVLNLFDEVFVTLLRESAAFLGVEVHVVRVHLENISVQVGGEVRRQIEIDADFVVLERNQWQIQTWVAVEEEDEWQVNSLTVNTSGHLTVVSLLGFIQVKLGVQTPPALVVLVNALATNGKFRRGNRTLGDPARWVTRVGVGRSSIGFEFDVHVTNQITIASNGHGNTTGVGWSTVSSLFDVFHREVSVALVNRLEESDFWVPCKIDILGTVRDKLHETTGHCESFCTIDQHFFSG